MFSLLKKNKKNMSCLSNDFIINVYPFFKYLENKYDIVFKMSSLMRDTQFVQFNYESKEPLDQNSKLSTKEDYNYNEIESETTKMLNLISTQVDCETYIYNMDSKYKLYGRFPEDEENCINYFFNKNLDDDSYDNEFYIDTKKYSKIYNKYKNRCIINHRDEKELSMLLKSIERVQYSHSKPTAERIAITIYKNLVEKMPDDLTDIIINYMSQHYFI